MIASKESFEPHSKYATGEQTHLCRGRAAQRCARADGEIELTPTKGFDGQIEVNEPVRVYDCSGPWGDPEFNGTVEEGLPALRREWILKRGDVEEYAGREVKPMDNGYNSFAGAMPHSVLDGTCSLMNW